MLASVLASSAVALAALLVAAPIHVDALVTPPGSGSQLGHLAARHAAPGISPNHNALARRKRNVHKNRKRCQQRPPSSQSSTDNNNNNNNNTPSSTPAPAPAPAPSATQPPYVAPSTTSGHGKLLLAWPNGGDDSIPISQYFTGKAARYYTWGITKVKGDNGLPFCPMLWSDKDNKGVDLIQPFVNTVVSGYTDCVFGINEPNEVGQSNINETYGAQLWNNYIGPLAYQGYTILGSPATSSRPNGLTWIQTWLNMIDVKPTVICIHWYDVGFPNFQKYVNDFYTGAGSRPIWITEFACQSFNWDIPQCNEGDIWNFVQAATGWMDSTDWIGMYAPFGYMRDMQGVNPLDQLMDPNNNNYPTALGSWFINSS